MPDDSEFYRKLPRQSRSRSVVNAIIMATDQLLENSGDPTALSLEGVARRAGVGIGSLYDYFANREGLLGALLARITEANFEELAREVQDSQKVPFAQAIPRILEKTIDIYLARPERTRGVISTVFRVGWLKPTIRERDRFAGLLAKRLLAEHPLLDLRSAVRLRDGRGRQRALARSRAGRAGAGAAAAGNDRRRAGRLADRRTLTTSRRSRTRCGWKAGGSPSRP